VGVKGLHLDLHTQTVRRVTIHSTFFSEFYAETDNLEVAPKLKDSTMGLERSLSV
jgi:hypothetical protein